MPRFAYVARDASGARREGRQESATAGAVASGLRDKGWLVLDVRPVVEEAAARSSGISLNPYGYLPPRSVDVELTLQQLSVMLRGGMTLLAALKTASEQARRPSMGRVLARVAERIQEGSTLAAAMEEHRAFGHLVLQLVKVGERTGGLEQVLDRAASALERRRILRTSVFTALMYPTLVLVSSLGVSAFLVLSVIPKIEVFLTALGRKLPPMTQALLDVSAFLRTNGPVLAIALVALGVVGVAVYRWPPGRLAADRLALRLPLLGSVFRLAGTATFSHGLAILLRSGITLLEGLRTVEDLHRNRHLSARVAEARRSVMDGNTLSAPLAARGAYMPMLSQMVAVGESAGTLEDVLDEVARFHESQLQAVIRQLSAIIEPVVIVVVGGIVGFVYISFFVALFAAAGGSK